jgi:hypothetical protein
MYIKYADYTGKLAKGDIVLMSAAEFLAGGSKLKGVPTAITPDGTEPVEPDMDVMPDIPTPDAVPEPDLQAEITLLKERLAKVEAAPIVKTELSRIISDPILTR